MPAKSILSYKHILFFPFLLSLLLDMEALQSVYAMEFAVKEINSNNSLLPGVKLGYHVLDECGRYPSSPLLSTMSLVGGDTHFCELEDSTRAKAGMTE